MEWVLYLVSNLNLHQVQIVEQEDLAEVNMKALEEHDEVQNTVKSLVIYLPRGLYSSLFR